MTLLKAIFCKFIGNFGIVHSGVVYRSGQAFILYPIWFVMWATKFFGGAGLKSVLNLSHKPEKDLEDTFEAWFCKVLGIKCYSWWTLDYDNFDEVWEKLIECPKPVVVHCEGGKDRTGGLIGHYERMVLKHNYETILNNWATHMIPANGWIEFLIARWEAK